MANRSRRARVSAAVRCAGAAAIATPAKKAYNITFVAALVNDSYFVTIKCGAQAEAKKLGVNLTWTGPT